MKHWYELFGQKVDRRDFLKVGRDAAFLISLGALPASAGSPQQVKLRSNPFTFGVASGDPSANGVVLWTRLDKSALTESDAAGGRVEVQWEIALDENFRRIARKGSSLALPELGHSVHAEVDGLSGRDYWYRFISGGQASATGRTRLATVSSDRLRFAFVSCQNYEHGHYTAYRHIAADDLDALVHLGDYIYEKRFTPAITVREHESGEIFTLDQYRGRYSTYRHDPDLQAAHAAFPWIATADDHEVSNNYANATAEDASIPPEQYLLRRAAAYQTYYEFLPFRRTSMPRGPSMRLYRRVNYGSLLDFWMLDTRQYRSDQPCGDGSKPRCAEALAPTQTMMGPEQEKWLFDNLRRSRSRWNVLGNQVMIAEVARMQNGVPVYAMDQWNGYVEARKRLLNFLAEAKPSNPVAITGDIHTHWVADLKLDSKTVATEFVGTSITSGGDGNDSTGEDTIAANPHIKFFKSRRGYVRVNVTPKIMTADYRTVPYVSRPGAPIETAATFVIEDGKPGANRT